MKVHLINPSDLSFGVGVITPRWLYVLAAATPEMYGDPVITDETLEPWDPDTVSAGDVVGIGIHTGNAAARLRDRQDRARRAARTSSSAAFTRRCTPRRPPSSAARTRSSKATATWSGPR